MHFYHQNSIYAHLLGLMVYAYMQNHHCLNNQIATQGTKGKLQRSRNRCESSRESRLKSSDLN